MIELKRPKGGKLSDNQKDIHEKLRCTGTYVFVAKRLSQVEGYLKPLLKLRDTSKAAIVRQLCEAQGG